MIQSTFLAKRTCSSVHDVVTKLLDQKMQRDQKLEYATHRFCIYLLRSAGDDPVGVLGGRKMLNASHLSLAFVRAGLGSSPF